MLIINLIKGKSDFNGFLNEIVNIDINIWIKNLGFDLYSEDAKTLERFNINIFNKTLISTKFKGNVFGKENNMNKAILNVTYMLPNEMQRKIIMDKQNLKTQKFDKAPFVNLVPNTTMTKLTQTKKVINKHNNEVFSDQSNINRKNKKQNQINSITEVKNPKNKGDPNPLSETMMILNKNQIENSNFINDFKYVMKNESIGDLDPITFNNKSININLNLSPNNNNINIFINNNNNFSNNGFNNNINNFNNNNNFNNAFSNNEMCNNFNNNFDQNRICNSPGNLGINNMNKMNMNNINNFVQDNMNLNNNNNFNNFNNNIVNNDKNFNNNKILVLIIISIIVIMAILIIMELIISILMILIKILIIIK